MMFDAFASGNDISTEGAGGYPGEAPSSSGDGLSGQAGLSAGLGLAGLGISLFGTEQGISAAKASAQASLNIAGLEQQVNAQKKLVMQISARRQGMETIRETQLKQSQATAAATNQGAQFGSGLQGGLAGLSGMGNYNLQGVNQGLQIGNTIFGLDDQISAQKIAEAKAKSDAATAAGTQSFGSMLEKAAPDLAKLAFSFI
jgi:hypothetical protein